MIFPCCFCFFAFHFYFLGGLPVFMMYNYDYNKTQKGMSNYCLAGPAPQPFTSLALYKITRREVKGNTMENTFSARVPPEASRGIL